MPDDPLQIVAEILGEPAATMRNPVNAGYACPFINSVCTKRGQRIAGAHPYPLCSVWHGQGSNRRMICLCPKRFYQADLIDDVLTRCWTGQRPSAPRVAYDVKLDGWSVDFVIADVDETTGFVRDFVSVDIQAVDCSGSVEPAFNAILNSVPLLSQRCSYGVNWANVRKRYVNQLINKGFYHGHWGSRVASVIQTPLYDFLHRTMQFEELAPRSPEADVVFLIYDYKPAADGSGAFQMQLDRVVGTSHTSLMMASLYRTPPAKQAFIDRITDRLNQLF